MQTQPTLETVLEYLKAMDARITAGFQEIKGELKILNRKLDILSKSNLDHEARIAELEELTTELTRPLPTN
jgi:hypothetical protein